MKTVVMLMLGAVLATALPAAARRTRAADTLQIPDAILKGAFGGIDCPQGSPSDALCWTINNKGSVRGLGMVSESGVLVVRGPHTSCEQWQSAPTLTVAGKGTITLSVQTPGCLSDVSGAALQAEQQFTVTGGTGSYAGASGSGTLLSVGVPYTHGSDMITGTLDAPATTFDLSPPTFAGASAKTLRMPKGKRSARVKYVVRASDAVDGPVPAACEPASGSAFEIGRTEVTCTATDSSGNTATARFTITVRR